LNAVTTPEQDAPAPASVSQPETQAGQSTARPAPPAFPAAAARPTQAGPHGLRYDFNFGARLVLPEGNWAAVLRDLDTGNILFTTNRGGTFIMSAKRYYVRFAVEAALDGEVVFRHEFDPRGREVLVQFPVGTLGDPMGWFPYAVKFQEQHGCRLTCAMSEVMCDLFRDAYPDITFVTHDKVEPERYYATYCIGLFFDDEKNAHQPCDFRYVGLHRTAAYILGVDPAEVAPRLALQDDSRPIAEPYVCIAAQASTHCKNWTNPTGWRDIIGFLKEHGYRVVCIDRQPVNGHGIVWNHMPHGVEDETGDKPLTERARYIRHADFFIGLSSGLSWLAWATGTPVVMISGFTHPNNEFATPYRVINYHACNSCWNDPKHRFDHHDFLWCPRHAGTSRQFECTRLITAEQVKAAIRRIPGFRAEAGLRAEAALPPGRSNMSDVA
jgi:autotransporter strand-loop-strand O-heptosyltransferase